MLVRWRLLRSSNPLAKISLESRAQPPLACIYRSSNTPSTPPRADLRISFATIVAGTSLSALKILTDVRCGGWGPFSVDPTIRDSGEPQGAYLSFLCLQCWSSIVREL